MPALQKAFDHFDALPSSLTGISFLSRLILHAEPGKPDDCFHSFFLRPLYSDLKRGGTDLLLPENRKAPL